MVTISKPLSAQQARSYHAEEVTNAQVNYYATDAAIRGTWHGRLAEHFGLAGDVDEASFHRPVLQPIRSWNKVILLTADQKKQLHGVVQPD